MSNHSIAADGRPAEAGLTSTGVMFEHDAIVRRAIDAFDSGTADFSDYFIHESSKEAGALRVLTFDKNFAREAGVDSAKKP